MIYKPFNLTFSYQRATGSDKWANIAKHRYALSNVSLLPVINFGLFYVFLPLAYEYFTPVKEVMIFIGYYLLEVYILFQHDNKYSNRPFLIRFYLYPLGEKKKKAQFAQIRPRQNESIQCTLLQRQLKSVALLVYNCLWKGFAIKSSASSKPQPPSHPAHCWFSTTVQRQHL